MKALRKISQETFDQAVLDEMEMFDVSDVKEAIEAVIKDFTAQSVDLSNIITTEEWAKGTNVVVDLVEVLNSSNIPSELIPHLNRLKEIVGRDYAHKLLAEKNGVYNLLNKLMKTLPELTDQVMDVMATFLDGYPDLMDPDGFENCINNMQKDCQPSTVGYALKWAAAACKMHEANRQVFIKMGITKLLTIHLESKEDNIVTNVCLLISLLTRDDDIREEISRAHNHACLLAEELLHKLTAALQSNTENAAVFLPLLGASCSLFVRNEFCEQFANERGIDTIFNGLLHLSNDPKVVRKAFLALAALAGNDEVKDKIVEKGAAAMISTHCNQYLKLPDVMVAALDLVSRLSLRSSKNAEELHRQGIVTLVCHIMNNYIKNEKLLVIGCRAIRNMAVRSQLVKDELKKAGADGLMRDIMSLYPHLKSNAEGCLKEIDPDYQPNIQILWTGKHGDKLKHN